MSASIRTIADGFDNEVYPKSLTTAIYDTNGNILDDILRETKMSIIDVETLPTSPNIQNYIYRIDEQGQNSRYMPHVITFPSLADNTIRKNFLSDQLAELGYDYDEEGSTVSSILFKNNSKSVYYYGEFSTVTGDYSVSDTTKPIVGVSIAYAPTTNMNVTLYYDFDDQSGSTMTIYGTSGKDTTFMLFSKKFNLYAGDSTNQKLVPIPRTNSKYHDILLSRPIGDYYTVDGAVHKNASDISTLNSELSSLSSSTVKIYSISNASTFTVNTSSNINAGAIFVTNSMWFTENYALRFIKFTTQPAIDTTLLAGNDIYSATRDTNGKLKVSYVGSYPGAMQHFVIDLMGTVTGLS